MNRLEARYADHLRLREAAGEVVWWRFGTLKLRLAPACFYDTDFVVQLADGTVEVHETKGFMRDDAAVKLKTAAALYPFVFRLVKEVAENRVARWEITEVPHG
jgi:hypothetical protein